MAINTNGGKTNNPNINIGVRQGDTLSATLFNVALEAINRKVGAKEANQCGQSVMSTM